MKRTRLTVGLVILMVVGNWVSDRPGVRPASVRAQSALADFDELGGKKPKNEKACHDAFDQDARKPKVDDDQPASHGKKDQDDERCVPPGSSSGVARGDFNGDGVGDLAIGVPFEDIGNLDAAGAVNVIYGSSLGLTAGGGTTGVPLNQFIHQDAQGIPGTAEAGDQFGHALASGDFDGDTFSDLAIGAPFEDLGAKSNVGTVVVVFGSSNGLDLARTQSVDGLKANENFGWSLVWGDFNGDTVADLAVGAPDRIVPSFERDTCTWVPPIFIRCTTKDHTAGGVSVVSGKEGAGLDLSTRFEFRQNKNPDQSDFPETFEEVGDGAETGDRFGATLTAGDFDNNGADDLVIGAPGNDEIIDPFSRPRDTGVIHILWGDLRGLANRGAPHNNYWVLTQDNFFQGNLLDLGDPVIGSAEEDDLFGASLATGRRNGFDRLYVGLPGEDLGSLEDAGAVIEFSALTSPETLNAVGSVLWSQKTDGIIGAEETGDRFGYSLASADFNGDGNPDLAIGVPFEDVNNTSGQNIANAGAVNIIYGQSTGLGTPGNQIWYQAIDPTFGTGQPNTNDKFGYSLVAWNFGRSGHADLAIGVPGESLFDRAEVGMVQVLYGGSSGLAVANNQFWHQDRPGILDQTETGDRFGNALY